jgi:hypothetical protein
MKINKINRKKYGGKYVATENFTSNKVLSSGKNPSKVYDKAIKKGIKEPVINFILKEGVQYIW